MASAGPGQEYPSRAAPSAELGLPQFRCISRGSTHFSSTDDRGSVVSCASYLQDSRQPLDRGMPAGHGVTDWDQAGLHRAGVPGATQRPRSGRGSFDYTMMPTSVAVRAPRPRFPAHWSSYREASGSIDMMFSDTESDCDAGPGVRTPPRRIPGRCCSPSGAMPMMTISISKQSGPPSPPRGVRDIQFVPGMGHRYLPSKRSTTDAGTSALVKSMAVWES